MKEKNMRTDEEIKARMLPGKPMNAMELDFAQKAVVLMAQGAYNGEPIISVHRGFIQTSAEGDMTEVFFVGAQVIGARGVRPVAILVTEGLNSLIYAADQSQPETEDSDVYTPVTAEQLAEYQAAKAAAIETEAQEFLAAAREEFGMGD